MATATITGAPTVIDNAEATTNWGGDTFALNTGEFVQGSNSVECALTTNGNNDVYVTGSWDFSGGGSGDQHVRLWFNITFVGNLSATNPIQIFFYDGTNTAYYYWDKSSDYNGGWVQAVIYTGDTPDSGSVTKSSITRIGMRFVTSTKPRNVPYNALFDAWTYGDGYTAYGGTSGDAIDWSHIATADAVGAYNIVEELNGVYFLRGAVQIGDGTNTTYFEPTGQKAQFVDEQIITGLYDISFVDSTSNLTNIDIAGGSFGGGTERYTLDASDTDLNAFTVDGLQVSSSGLVTMFPGASVTNCAFSDCQQIDPSTGTFEDNTVSDSTVTDGALLWPGGVTVANCSFLNNARPSVEIAQTANQTFDGNTFSGNTYDVHLNNGGTNIDISKNNGANPTTYIATGGGVVTFIGASVTVQATAALKDGTPIESARVYLKASDGTGPFPFEETVTITRSTTTATVSHTAHGMATNDKIVLEGITDKTEDNHSVKQITVSDANTYTYTTTDSGSTSYTGTIKSTFVALNGLTNASGVFSLSRVYTSNQPVTGWTRKSSASPFLQEGVLVGEVDNSTGFAGTAVMVSDE